MGITEEKISGVLDELCEEVISLIDEDLPAEDTTREGSDCPYCDCSVVGSLLIGDTHCYGRDIIVNTSDPFVTLYVSLSKDSEGSVKYFLTGDLFGDEIESSKTHVEIHYCPMCGRELV